MSYNDEANKVNIDIKRLPDETHVYFIDDRIEKLLVGSRD